MWFVANWSAAVSDLDAGLTHPGNIQEWHREQKTTEALLVGRKLHLPAAHRGQRLPFGFEPKYSHTTPPTRGNSPQ